MAFIAAVQMASTSSVEENMAKASAWIKKAAQNRAKVVVLPEEFATLGLTAQEKKAWAEMPGKGPLQEKLAQAAREYKIWVIGGTLPLISPHPDKVFASTLVWDAQGQVVARYDKMHLFDVTVTTQEAYCESAYTERGKAATVIETPVGKVGLAICYDLRFPELFRDLMKKGAEVLVLPSAFTVTTGQAHWEILLKARAIENLCYMVAPNQIGHRANGQGTYGHSMIVGPWGECCAALTIEEEIVLAHVDKSKIHQIRQQFPVLTHIIE